jgi:hypothetical protein
VTWFGVIWLIGQFHGGEYTVQAATGIPALIVLLIVMNWFFHKVYWTGWISHHHKRRRGLLSSDPETNQRRMLMGLALLGFTSVYRECFEVVIFLQNLRELYGASVVLEGVVIGCLFTGALAPTPAGATGGTARPGDSRSARRHRHSAAICRRRPRSDLISLRTLTEGAQPDGLSAPGRHQPCCVALSPGGGWLLSDGEAAAARHRGV